MNDLPETSVAEHLATHILALAIPAAVREKCVDLAVDVIGLCVTARNADYVQATLAGCDPAFCKPCQTPGGTVTSAGRYTPKRNSLRRPNVGERRRASKRTTSSMPLALRRTGSGPRLLLAIHSGEYANPTARHPAEPSAVTRHV